MNFLLKSISILLVAFLFSCAPSKEQKSGNQKKTLPNIILLIGDDHGYPYFGFMGADYVQTPNMDKLVANGTLFTDGYVPDNHCKPSLATLVTGILPVDYKNKANELLQKELSNKKFDSVESQQKFEQEFNFHSMQHFETLPKLLATKGYTSFQGGKWWEFNYQNGGFTEGMTTGWTEEDRKVGGKWFKKYMGGEGLNLGRATMEPVYEFIDNNKENPFFIWYAPELPHYPFDAPDKYYNLYKDQDMTESAKRYYANCTWFDDGVGELVRHLKEVGEYHNTLFVYVNDNGWEQTPEQAFTDDPMRSHNGGDKGKSSIYDQSFRTPIVFTWERGIEKGKRFNNLIHSADIPATILDYVGISIPNHYIGKSYKAIISGQDLTLRKEIFGNTTTHRDEQSVMGRPVEGYWLRDKNWFFRWNVTDNEIGLYDMQKDPNNDVNLAAENPDLVGLFSQKIEDWKKTKNL